MLGLEGLLIRYLGSDTFVREFEDIVILVEGGTVSESLIVGVNSSFSEEISFFVIVLELEFDLSTDTVSVVEGSEEG